MREEFNDDYNTNVNETVDNFIGDLAKKKALEEKELEQNQSKWFVFFYIYWAFFL